jgi:nicotinate-nucleotide adenylyltransferase
MKRIAYFGGSFDPVHKAHLRIAQKLPELFTLDEFVFVPAFHAPHKAHLQPLSAYHRFAMLTLATAHDDALKVSTIELDAPEKPFTVETVEKLLRERGGGTQLFFVIGGDSWRDITTWRDWENLLLMVNFIVVERPGVTFDISHVTDAVGERIIDLRGKKELEIVMMSTEHQSEKIYYTDAVRLDIAATAIREDIEENDPEWRDAVPDEVVRYIEKYQIYK